MAPIGIFDSGIGGLSVLLQCKKIFPHDDFLYLGDTFHLPYGKKTRREVLQYTKNAFAFFEKHHVKAGIIGCNTATAAAFYKIKNDYSFPVIGVIAPACEEVIRKSKTKKVLLLGTDATVKSMAYHRELQKHDPSIQIEGIGCPHLVLAIEDGLGEHYIGGKIAQEYIEQANTDFDTLILGCTHFPFVAKNIKEYFRHIHKDVTIIDPAIATVNVVKDLVNPKEKGVGKTTFYITGDPKKFGKVAKKIVGERINPHKCILPIS